MIFRYNEVHGNQGAGVRIGGHTFEGHTYGQEVEMHGNIFADNAQGVVKVQTGGNTHKMCETTCKGGCEVGGSAADGYQDIEKKCDGVMEIFWVGSNKAVPVSASTKSVSTAADGGEPDDAPDEPEAEPNPEPEAEFYASVSQSKKSSESDRCYPVPIKGVDVSSEDGKHTVHAAIAKQSFTRWSARGEGEWLEIDFDARTKIDAIEISFFKGDERTQNFAVAVDDKVVLEKQQSSGKTLAMQRFMLPKEMEASSVKIEGGGNSENEWNLLTEVIVCGVDKPKADLQQEDPNNSKEVCDKVEKLPIDRART